MRAIQLINVFVFGCLTAFSQNDTLNQTAADGLREGYWKIYKDLNGKKFLSEEGRYLKNLKTGKWTEYFENGNVKSDAEFKNGTPNGKTTNFDQKGSLRESGTRRFNGWYGEYVLYFPNSTQPQHHLYYNEIGKWEGKQLSYYANGQLYREANYNNGIAISATQYYENGKEKILSYEDSTQFNFQKESNKQYKEFVYQSLPYVPFTGERKTYYENGNVKFKCSYKNDRMYGERMCYEMDGKPANGYHVTYHKDNIKEREGKCINGLPEGEFKLYDLRGNVSIIANYKNGKAHGSIYYYRYDAVYKTEKYNEGNFVEEIRK